MAIRGSNEWGEPPNVRFLTSEGKDRIEGNHTRPDWTAMSGAVEGSAVSILAMGSPENFRYPQPVRLNPTAPYFCFAPMVVGEFRIEPGQVYRSAYRFLIHDGEIDADRYGRIWAGYRSPPASEIR